MVKKIIFIFYNIIKKLLIPITELSKALLSYEVGTSRDPEKMKVVLKNVNTLVPLAHG